MKLPDFTVFEPFNRLRKLMDAPLVDTLQITHSLIDWEKIAEEGIPLGDVHVLPDATLAYKNSRYYYTLEMLLLTVKDFLCRNFIWRTAKRFRKCGCIIVLIDTLFPFVQMDSLPYI